MSSLEREIEETRERLAGTIDQLAYRAHPKTIVNRQVTSMKGHYVDLETGQPRTDNILKTTGIVVGVVAVFVLMLTDVFSWLTKALAWQGDFFAGWVGIVMVHMPFFRNRGEVEFRAGRVARVTPGLVVWVASAAFGIWLTQSSSAPALLHDLATIAVLVVSAVLYAVVQLVVPSVVARHADPRDEVADPWSAYVECHHCGKSYVAVEMDRHPETGEPACDGCSTNGRTLRLAR